MEKESHNPQVPFAFHLLEKLSQIRLKKQTNILSMQQKRKEESLKNSFHKLPSHESKVKLI